MSSNRPVPVCRLPNSGVRYHELDHGCAPSSRARDAEPGWSPSDIPSGPKAAIAPTASDRGVRLGVGLGNKPWCDAVGATAIGGAADGDAVASDAADAEAAAGRVAASEVVLDAEVSPLSPAPSEMRSKAPRNKKNPTRRPTKIFHFTPGFPGCLGSSDS